MKKPSAGIKSSPNLSLKIGFVFDDSLDSLDGVAQIVKTLGKWYSQQGHQVSYLVGETSINDWYGGKVYSLAKNFRVKFNKNYATIPLFTNKSKIQEILRDQEFDVLHIQMPYSPFLAGRIINLANKGTVIVGSFHVAPAGLGVIIGTKLLRQLCSRSLKKFDAFFSVSKTAQIFAKSSFGIESAVIPNAIDLNSFLTMSEDKDPVKNELKILFLGRLVERKGVGLLLEAFSDIQKKHPHTKLIIAGSGPLQDKLQRRSISLKISDKVEFMGFIPEENKPKILAAADIACFPAITGESFGIVLIEAMAAGSGVVLAASNPGYKSVMESTPEALFNPRNKADFVECIDSFILNKNLKTKIHRSQAKLVKQYDVSKVGREFLNAYESEIAKKSKRSNN